MRVEPDEFIKSYFSKFKRKDTFFVDFNTKYKKLPSSFNVDKYFQRGKKKLYIDSMMENFQPYIFDYEYVVWTSPPKVDTFNMWYNHH
ncbi:hypothetical protein M902_2744 [Bacteriovorax sp. BAL6_X]|nr:hypothetical protein M902_2744 [Bacteriovorax sp. BAL6_X]